MTFTDILLLMTIVLIVACGIWIWREFRWLHKMRVQHKKLMDRVIYGKGVEPVDWPTKRQEAVKETKRLMGEEINDWGKEKPPKLDDDDFKKIEAALRECDPEIDIHHERRNDS